MSSDPSIVTLNLSISNKQIINITGLGIEPVHAQIFLDEIDALRARLASLATNGRQATDGTSTVIPFRKSA